MWVRWLADRPLAEEQCGGDLAVRPPSATSAATRRSAAVSPSSRVRPPMRPSSPRAVSIQVAAPSCSKPSSAAAIASRAGRFCRARLRTMPSASSARARPNGSPTSSCRRDRLLAAARRPRRPRLRRSDETAAARHVREHPLAAEPRRIRLPAVEDSHRVVDPAELEQRLYVVGGPRARVRLAPPEPRACRSARRATPRPSPRLRSRARRGRGPPGAGADGVRSAPRTAPAPAPTARERARAARDGRRSTRSGGSPASSRPRTGR